ncbi:hypothetical protein TVAG_259240 [Trichomonas vaginalis G3]|uniref:Uncharacterized protein n=1 Tax=Trichomonas vaginalis (strain ATCC PRA-98 / G3) TaxID=412133 RepID=A2EBX5_TRIV3|nr:hypothetical protein TVAGG3_0652550 [Trichomonas vaginalis G3]EAY09843.1 hypothetical protein TVAG_259240 [Trichomonas vaginalis G3]KAI5505927.1 hypothetical protein TVAGG3_0652550 [Trichomonas vaginalis G3]|eukprot:XP_001322066.1 hypothetical protein [Trichomonas vaginalis G3]
MYRAEPVLNQHLEVMKHQRAFQLHTERLKTQKSTIDQSPPPPCPRLQIYRERRTKELQELFKFSQKRIEMLNEITGYHEDEKKAPLSARISLKPNITKPAISKTKRVHTARDEEDQKVENEEQKPVVQEPKKPSPKKNLKRTNPRRKGKKLPVVESVDQGEYGFVAEIDSKVEDENKHPEEEAQKEEQQEKETAEEEKKEEKPQNEDQFSLKKEFEEKLEPNGDENQESTPENQNTEEEKPANEEPPKDTQYTGLTINDHVEEVSLKTDGDPTNDPKPQEEEHKEEPVEEEKKDDFDDFADADDERPAKQNENPSEGSFNGILLDKLVPNAKEEESHDDNTNLGRTFSNDFDLSNTGGVSETNHENNDDDFDSTLGNSFTLTGAIKDKLEDNDDNDDNFEKDFD